MEREALQRQIKEIIVSSLDLEDVTVADINPAAPLFGTGLGLDSIDALELGMALRRKLGVRFSSDPAENKAVFRSVDTLTDFILKAREGERHD